MMKLVILGDAANPHIQRWTSYFVKQNFEIHVISFRPASINGVTIHFIKPPGFLIISPVTGKLRKLGYFFLFHKVRNLIHSLGPDILHAHFATSYGLAGVYSGFHPLIISTWGIEITDSPKKSWIMKKIIEYVLFKSDVVTATSGMLMKETKKYVKYGKPVHQIPFGIDISKFSPFIKKDENRTICIGTVKDLEEKYGIEYLVQAFSRAKCQFDNIRLLIIGQGSMHKKLIKLTKTLGIFDCTTFAGRIPNNEIVNFLHLMDIFLVPSISKSETFGVAAVEASACGLPVIASNIGGLPEVVIDGRTGFLVDPKNIEDITEKLLILINDEKMRKKMGYEGRKYIESNYTLEKCGLMMENIYNEVVNFHR